jgi:hypothetical protein
LTAHREHARVDLSMPVPAIAGVPGSNGHGNGKAILPQGLPPRPDIDLDDVVIVPDSSDLEATPD